MGTREAHEAAKGNEIATVIPSQFLQLCKHIGEW